MAWKRHLNVSSQKGSDDGSLENIQSPTATALDSLIPAGRSSLKPETRHPETEVLKHVPPIIHVVDDDPSFRTAVTRLLRAAKYEVRGYASASEFLDFDPYANPGCILLDLRMPGASGLDLQQSLAQMEERLPIIFLTGHGDIPASVRAMKAGAVDFLTKPVRREALLRAVQNALGVDAKGRAARAVLRELHDRYENLTPREREVLAHVVSGKLNKQIAFDLGAAERTIKAHRASIMDKLGVQSVAELARLAQELGIQPIR
jgi:FixJ family two-component response regulator